MTHTRTHPGRAARPASTPTATGMRRAIGLLLAGSVSVLGGCATEPPRSTMTTLIAEAEGSSPLEADAFVRAARVADLGQVLAWNAQDFTLPDLTLFTSARAITEQYRAAEAGATTGEPFRAFPGPRLWLPLRVDANDAGDAAQITVCTVDRDWFVTSDHRQAHYDLTAGTKLTLSMITDEKSGRLVYDGETTSSEACDATGAPVQRLDPVPDTPTAVAASDITAPAD